MCMDYFYGPIKKVQLQPNFVNVPKVNLTKSLPFLSFKTSGMSKMRPIKLAFAKPANRNSAHMKWNLNIHRLLQACYREFLLACSSLSLHIAKGKSAPSLSVFCSMQENILNIQIISAVSQFSLKKALRTEFCSSQCKGNTG